jgi:pyrimidine operon attenuation protein/uracil phosphoribosyltransferase
MINEPKILLNSTKANLIIRRFALQIIENHKDYQNTAVIGLQPRGILLAKSIHNELLKLGANVLYGEVDHTFFRDDIGRGEIHIPKPSNMPFSTEKLRIVLIDDVLYTGRSVRASIDALMSFGRPAQIELLVLINRRYQRELPIEPTYIGTSIDSRNTEEYVKVDWTNQQEHVLLLSNK